MEINKTLKGLKNNIIKELRKFINSKSNGNQYNFKLWKLIQS